MSIVLQVTKPRFNRVPSDRVKSLAMYGCRPPPITAPGAYSQVSLTTMRASSHGLESLLSTQTSPPLQPAPAARVSEGAGVAGDGGADAKEAGGLTPSGS